MATPRRMMRLALLPLLLLILPVAASCAAAGAGRSSIVLETGDFG